MEKETKSIQMNAPFLFFQTAKKTLQLRKKFAVNKIVNRVL